MPLQRISLVEAYDNRDVIAWLVRHQVTLDRIEDWITNGLPSEFVAVTGDQNIDGVKTFLQKIVASGGLQVDGTLEVNGDILQNGAAYETHAEKLYVEKDEIILRENAVTAIPSGSESGLKITKYDGTNDLHFGVDSTGTARVGDTGSEQPLLTRDEAANMTNGNPLVWDSTHQRAKTGTFPASGVQRINNAVPNNQGRISLAAKGMADIEFTLQDTNTIQLDVKCFTRRAYAVIDQYETFGWGFTPGAQSIFILFEDVGTGESTMLSQSFFENNTNGGSFLNGVSYQVDTQDPGHYSVTFNNFSANKVVITVFENGWMSQ